MKDRRTGLAIIGALAIGAGLLAWFVYGDIAVPALGRGLPGDAKAADMEFSQRVKQRFPPGSTAQDMRLELAQQGFEVQEPATSPGAGSASFEKTRPPCKFIWDIQWQADEAGNLTAIVAAYGGDCP